MPWKRHAGDRESVEKTETLEKWRRPILVKINSPFEPPRRVDEAAGFSEMRTNTDMDAQPHVRCTAFILSIVTQWPPCQKSGPLHVSRETIFDKQQGSTFLCRGLSCATKSLSSGVFADNSPITGEPVATVTQSTLEHYQ